MAVDKKQQIDILLEDIALLERYIKEIFTFSPIPICFVSLKGFLLETNPAFEELSGYDLYELINEPIEKFFFEKEIDLLAKEVLKKGDVKAKELVFFNKDKKEIPVSAFAKVRKDDENKVVGFFLSLLDLSKMKGAEKKLEERIKELEDLRKSLLNILEDAQETSIALKKEKQKTEIIVANLVDGIILFDHLNKVSLINPGVEQLFDVQAKDILEKPIIKLASFKNLEPLVKILGGEIRKVSNVELTINENLIVQVSSIPLEGKGSLVIIRDITREKRVERMKTEFVTLAAHQLRTPLSAIKWSLRMVLDDKGAGKISKEQASLLEKSYTSNERMIHLVNDLLNVTKIEEGRYLFNPVLTNFEEVLILAIDSFKSRIKQKRIKFVLIKPKKIPKLVLDPEQIKLAIQNLIDNAIKYTPEKGKIEASVEETLQGLYFQIKDEGVGIPLKEQHGVFNKFFRGSNVIKFDTEGTGLGLFLAKNIIEAHNGTIGFESSSEGSTFYFTIPIKKTLGPFLKKEFY